MSHFGFERLFTAHVSAIFVYRPEREGSITAFKLSAGFPSWGAFWGGRGPDWCHIEYKVAEKSIEIEWFDFSIMFMTTVTVFPLRKNDERSVDHSFHSHRKIRQDPATKTRQAKKFKK